MLVCPAAPTAVPPHALAYLEVEGERFHPRAAMRATVPFDLTGSPAVTVPFAWSADGLPLGVQLVGRPWEDEAVLAAAAELEARSDWEAGRLARTRAEAGAMGEDSEERDEIAERSLDTP